MGTVIDLFLGRRRSRVAAGIDVPGLNERLSDDQVTLTIAGDVAEQSNHPALRAGKSVDPYAGEEIMELLRPRRFTCTCGQPATFRLGPPGKDARFFCSEHRPLGIYGVVDGDGAA